MNQTGINSTFVVGVFSNCGLFCTTVCCCVANVVLVLYYILGQQIRSMSQRYISGNRNANDQIIAGFDVFMGFVKTNQENNAEH